KKKPVIVKPENEEGSYKQTEQRSDDPSPIQGPFCDQSFSHEPGSSIKDRTVNIDLIGMLIGDFVGVGNSSMAQKTQENCQSKSFPAEILGNRGSNCTTQQDRGENK
ncbi:unnamed protein product, partial [marine sediment metagenome]